MAAVAGTAAETAVADTAVVAGMAAVAAVVATTRVAAVACKAAAVAAAGVVGPAPGSDTAGHPLNHPPLILG